MKDKGILSILTTDDIEEMRRSVKDICMAQIRKDIQSVYLIDDGDIRDIHQEMLAELTEEIKKELKKEYGDIIKQNILSSLKL